MDKENLNNKEPISFDQFKEDPQIRFKALHNQFIASALAVKKDVK